MSQIVERPKQKAVGSQCLRSQLVYSLGFWGLLQSECRELRRMGREKANQTQSGGHGGLSGWASEMGEKESELEALMGHKI